ncbi:agmatine coumaroyltransferase-2-like [Mercurialis annua]|uniref:agmatine coumaroyltransferase-2-like n=1 Tax=Mercurialis annua TaxID=3986 RepID=UPI0021602086|nr:agmatine coumaroyltransferase-2-like [Mercurialis annua]
MKVIMESIRTIKPTYEGNPQPQPQPLLSIPLTVFDKVSYNIHFAVIYAYRPPTPPNAILEYGLKKALAKYREWAGRLGENEKGDPVIILNDKGVKFVEASVDNKLDEVMPSEPTSDVLNLHPNLDDVEELLQVQLTRFTCGSLVVGFTTQHMIADGHAVSNFLVAWGRASRGLDVKPLPLHDRNIFNCRSPPYLQFEHGEIEYKVKGGDGTKLDEFGTCNKSTEDIVIRKIIFTSDFLSKLKARVSSGITNNNNKPCTTFEVLVAHIWRTITKAHGLGGSENVHVRISVDGRRRMIPKVPNEFFGNLVLWTYPTTSVDDLLSEPLAYATQLIHNNITELNHNYFQSFIDFATLKAKDEGLVSVAKKQAGHSAMEFLWKVYPNMDVYSWLQFPFNELDFGGGRPYLFMPSYCAMEGVAFLVPSLTSDGSIVVFVTLFKDHMTIFEQIVYSLD